MASGILGTGVSGLAAAQFGLDTTGHNIANVNTEGYSRQRVETESTVGNAFRSTFLGNGTQLAAITRTFNEFNYNEVIFNESQYNYNETRLTNASRLDNLLADPDTGITATFEEMFNGINGVVEEPTLISARNVVLSTAENTVKRFNTLYEEVAVQHMGSINEEIYTSVSEINSITSEIALLNSKIQVENAVGSEGFAPNDLLDSREQLIKRLSQMTQVDTIQLDDGTVNVTVGQGVTLVTGAFALPMSVIRNEFDSGILEIGVSTKEDSESKSIVTDQLSGGSVSSLLDVRDEMIMPAIRELGKLAIVIADSFNRQQSLGRDLNGEVGSNLFSDINDPQLVLSRTFGAVTNPVESKFEINIRNSSQLTTDIYDLDYDGTDLIVSDAKGNVIESFDPAQIAQMNAGTELTIGNTGLSMAIDTDNMTAGDRWQINALKNGASKIDIVIEDPKLIAAADNYFEIDSVTNTNNVSLSLYEINNVSNASYPSPNNVPPLPDPMLQIVVDATGTQYDIQDSAGNSVNGGFQDIAADKIINGPGFTMQFEGELAGNEVFNLTHADNDLIPNDNKKFGPGDNTNMLSMLNFQSKKTMDNGLNSFSEGYADLVTAVGVDTKSTEIARDSYQTLLSGSSARLAAVQGVNLDEEAANLIQYQQAYSASARIITVARETFQTLLSAAG
ncbi:flagellar hook-associated protein FlgK [Psychrosphaera sp. B3R10]|nr:MULTISPECIES: flagellar hook-associated protein FlgK [unclassified Psychrosphaera]MBU2884067.1 flagellar hook-associated protein FlgK [Psychrosphaera sp. I2R16]MBU2988197.1 flagellar hook-associated protein FlgK [Psychrosphaera sp. B3R10]MDO6718406.1 flagellar hook-associated protein FlgK [Psychrosphaera sp. 1_MG-2023]